MGVAAGRLEGGGVEAAGSLEMALRKSDRAYRWLRERIDSGHFAANDRLVLGPIAAELGMSVVPVRAATQRLAAEGLVTFEPHAGARVATVDTAHYLEALQVIGIVESTATALSAPHLTFDDLSQARALNARMRGHLAELDARGFSALNHRFHRLLYSRCPNPDLLGIIATEWERLAVVRDPIFSLVPGRPVESIREHEALLDLIEGGAPAAEIEAAMRRHRAGTLRAYLSPAEAEENLLLRG